MVKTWLSHGQEGGSIPPRDIFKWRYCRTIVALRGFWNKMNSRPMRYNKPKISIGAATLHHYTYWFVKNRLGTSIHFFTECFRFQDGIIPLCTRRLSHIQYQVLLKWNHQDVRGLIEDSLSLLGINPQDLQFIPDNWSAPVIQAYGIGFEVRWRGMEIMQITLFEKFLGHEVCLLEIVYGVERISEGARWETPPFKKYQSVSKNKSLAYIKEIVREYRRWDSLRIRSWYHVQKGVWYFNLIDVWSGSHNRHRYLQAIKSRILELVGC